MDIVKKESQCQFKWSTKDNRNHFCGLTEHENANINHICLICKIGYEEADVRSD